MTPAERDELKRVTAEMRNAAVRLSAAVKVYKHLLRHGSKHYWDVKRAASITSCSGLNAIHECTASIDRLLAHGEGGRW